MIVFNSQTAEADSKKTIKEVLQSKNILDITHLDSHLSIQVELILSLSEKDISGEEVKVDSNNTSKVEHLQVKPSLAHKAQSITSVKSTEVMGETDEE